MRTHLETEAEMARAIAQGITEDLRLLDQYLPKSKRGSNVQRVMDKIRSRTVALVQCLEDGLATAEAQPKEIANG